MYTSHGHWFAPILLGEVKPDSVSRCGGTELCADCHNEKRRMVSKIILTVPSWLAAQLLVLAKHCPGREVCGYILCDEAMHVLAVFPIPNVHPKPKHHFRMDGNHQVAAMANAAAVGLRIWGMYHSHPEGPETPSEADNENLPVHDCVQAIVLPQLGQVRFYRYDQNNRPQPQPVMFYDG
jgi:proteasome lid subunit RPN8/RPN11